MDDPNTSSFSSRWAEIIETAADPMVVPSEQLRAAIAATGLPWRVRDRRTRIELLLVPPREFQMGHSLDTLNADDHGPGHTVVITRPFYLGRYLVTQQQFCAVCRSNPSDRAMFFGPLEFLREELDVESPFKAMWELESEAINGCVAPRPALDLQSVDEWPVESVSYYDCIDFACRSGFRLPTEAEWESVASDKFCAGKDSEWRRDDILTFPVGRKRANLLGFYDMVGNVGEWVSDWYSVYGDDDPAIDPLGPLSGAEKVVRGLPGTTSWFRGSNAPMARDSFIGFRVARDP